MTLQTLESAVRGARIVGNDSESITDLAYDSRAVGKGTAFFCVRGAHADGHEFAARAVGAGAAALVVEHALDAGVPQVVVPSVRAAMGPMAAAFFDHPSQRMTLVGVTGTNGKTTTTYMLESVFRALGLRSGLIGNIERHIGSDVEPASRNTPEAIDLQRLLAKMRSAGTSAVAMEVTSEGLHFERVTSTRFACSLFTNLTRDHLNTHGTMDAYFTAKSLLFRPEMSRGAVVNADDRYARRLRDRLEIPCVTFGFGPDAEVCAEDVRLGGRSSSCTVDARGIRFDLVVSMPGRFNVSNALGVIGAAVAMDWDLDDVARGIEAMTGVPGRLERIDAGQDFTVLVDYAHTPDALEGVLRATRDLVPQGGKLIVVFGCGGDRDRAKRPLMGRAAAVLADRTFITSDNPRTEDPRSIIEQIEEGARSTGAQFSSIADRREAIGAAFEAAGPGDVVVIAGKGHETGQEFSDRTIPFDDRTVAREVLEQT